MNLTGFHVRTRPTTPGDMPVLEAIDLEADRTVGWRLHGEVLSPAARAASAWTSVLAQRLVIATDADEPAGYVTAYDANLRSGTVWLAVASTEHHRGRGTLMAGVGLFLTELFSQYPIRRCLAECAAENLGFYESVIAEGTFVVEGTFAGHHRRPDGSFTDVSLLAVERDHWMETWGRFVLRRVARHDNERNVDELRGLYA